MKKFIGWSILTSLLLGVIFAYWWRGYPVYLFITAVSVSLVVSAIVRFAIDLINDD